MSVPQSTGRALSTEKLKSDGTPDLRTGHHRWWRTNKISPIPKCHPDRKYAAHGLCDKCYIADYRKKHHAKLLAKAANAWLKRKYGISTAIYEQMLLKQEGGCAICRQPPRDIKLHVDRCHVTNTVRGLLCNRCNWFLEKIDASAATRKRLREYIDASVRIRGEVE